MTPADAALWLKDVSYHDYTFEVEHNLDWTSFYLQGWYVDRDIATGDTAIQRTRKWQLSQHMTKSEFIQTVFKCALTSAEHRVREGFLYKGKRVYSPHFDVDALHGLCVDKAFDYRKEAPHDR